MGEIIHWHTKNTKLKKYRRNNVWTKSMYEKRREEISHGRKSAGQKQPDEKCFCKNRGRKNVMRLVVNGEY